MIDIDEAGFRLEWQDRIHTEVTKQKEIGARGVFKNGD